MCYDCKTPYKMCMNTLDKTLALESMYRNAIMIKRHFEIGDAVWLYNPRHKKGRCHKLDIPWDGPFFVTRILGNVVFEIRMNRHSKSEIVHVGKLAPVKNEFDNSSIFKLPKKLFETL